MKAHHVIHRAAISLLVVVAAMSLQNILRSKHGTPLTHIVSCIFALATWGFLTWKIWKRPHGWGLGVGILLFVIFAFQSYLWHLAGFNPTREQLGMDYTMLDFVLYESPIVSAALCCILLKWLYPSDGEPTPA